MRDVAKALEGKFGEPRKAALVWKPKNTVAVDDEKGEKLFGLIETLNEHDDVQNVYANFEVSDALVAKVSARSHRRIGSSSGRLSSAASAHDHIGDVAIEPIRRSP